MDPVSTLSVAAAAVAFIDFGLKEFRLLRQIWKSVDSTPQHYEDLVAKLPVLDVLISDLQPSQTHATDNQIARLAVDCTTAARDFKSCVSILSKASGNFSPLHKAKTYLRFKRQRNKLDSLEKSLYSLQTQLETSVIFSIRQRVTLLQQEQQQHTSSLRDEYRSIIANISNGESRLSKVVTENLALLGQKVDQTKLDISLKIESEIELLKDEILRDGRISNLLDSLFFKEFKLRQETVQPAHARTCSWIFADGAGDSTATVEWSSFPGWLRSDDSIYWICGVLGSGKSTLMNFIIDEEQTRSGLLVWTGPKPLLTPAFFFWRPGTAEQRSVEGLLRSLSYQLITALQGYPEDVVRIMQNVDEAGHAQPIPSWTLSRLRRLLLSLVTKAVPNICFFIDGLDEFEGDINVLCDLISDLAVCPNVKLCVSSRPEVRFSRKFQDRPQLHLEQLNARDIRRLVIDTFQPYPKLVPLTESVFDLSQGIFLWVKLVTESLVEGIHNYDTTEQLRARLWTFPQGMKPLYTHLLAQIDPLYHKEAAIYFRMAASLKTRGSDRSFGLWDCTVGMSLQLYYLRNGSSQTLGLLEENKGSEEVLPDSAESLRLQALRQRERVHICSGGLLKCYYIGYADRAAVLLNPITTDREEDWCEMLEVMREWRIDFLHRSVYEFIQLDNQPQLPFLSAVPDLDSEVQQTMLLNHVAMLVFPQVRLSETFMLRHSPDCFPYRMTHETLRRLSAFLQNMNPFHMTLIDINLRFLSRFGQMPCLKQLPSSRYEAFEDEFTIARSGVYNHPICPLWLAARLEMYEYTASRLVNLQGAELMNSACAVLVHALDRNFENMPFVVDVTRLKQNLEFVLFVLRQLTGLPIDSDHEHLTYSDRVEHKNQTTSVFTNQARTSLRRCWHLLAQLSLLIYRDWGSIVRDHQILSTLTSILDVLTRLYAIKVFFYISFPDKHHRVLMDEGLLLDSRMFVQSVLDSLSTGQSLDCFPQDIRVLLTRRVTVGTLPTPAMPSERSRTSSTATGPKDCSSGTIDHLLVNVAPEIHKAFLTALSGYGIGCTEHNLSSVTLGTSIMEYSSAGFSAILSDIPKDDGNSSSLFAPAHPSICMLLGDKPQRNHSSLDEVMSFHMMHKCISKQLCEELSEGSTDEGSDASNLYSAADLLWDPAPTLYRMQATYGVFYLRSP